MAQGQRALLAGAALVLLALALWPWNPGGVLEPLQPPTMTATAADRPIKSVRWAHPRAANDPYAATQMTGWVRDATTEEGVMASLHVWPEFGIPELSGAPDGGATFVSRPDGSFALLGIPAGIFKVQVSAPGYATAELGFEKYPVVEDDEGWVIRLRPQEELHGVVRGTDGQTAQVFCWNMLHVEQCPGTTTDPEGYFHVPGFSEPMLLMATLGERQGSLFVSSPGVVDLTLEPTAPVRVELWSGGRTVAGEVRFLSKEPPALWPATDWLPLDGAAEFRVVNPVAVEGRAPGHPEVLFNPDNADGPWRIELTPGLALQGRVQTQDGEPLANARVSGRPEGSLDLVLPPQRTSSEGTFGWPQVRSERYLLLAEHPDHPEVEVLVVPPFESVVLVVPSGGELAGTVVDRITGAPITAKVLIELVGRGGRHFREGSSGSGRFVLRRLPPGEYDLYVSAGEYSMATYRAVAVPGPPLTVRLEPPAQIFGVVEALGLVQVTLENEAGDVVFLAQGEDDRFWSPKVPSGRYWLVASRSHGPPLARMEVFLPAGESVGPVTLRGDPLASP